MTVNRKVASPSSLETGAERLVKEPAKKEQQQDHHQAVQEPLNAGEEPAILIEYSLLRLPNIDFL